MVTHYGGGVEKRLFSASLFASIAQIIVITFGGLIILNSLCIAITPPITALGVGGLAIARANSVASNFLAPGGTRTPIFEFRRLVPYPVRPRAREVGRGDWIRTSGPSGPKPDALTKLSYAPALRHQPS